MSPGDAVQFVHPRYITGVHPPSAPRCCAHWGSQGLLAFGNGLNIVVLSSDPLQILSSLSEHRSNVNIVKWEYEAYNHSMVSPYRTWLASSDEEGTIIIWDVAAASSVTQFSDGNRPILSLSWLTTLQHATRDLLVALHPSYSLIMWNAASGNKLWKKSYTSEILSFSLNPFDSSCALLLSKEFILHVKDFTITQPPSSDGIKLPIPTDDFADANIDTTESASISANRYIARQISNVISQGVIKSPSGDANHTFSGNSSIKLDILQLEFLANDPDHIMIVMPHRLGIINFDLWLPVTWIVLENSISAFVQVYPCAQRRAFYCLHNNGNITFRVERPNYSTETSKKSPSFDVRLQSESIRVSKQNRVLSLAVCPTTERFACIVCSDGRVFSWSMNKVHKTAKLEEKSGNMQLLPSLRCRRPKNNVANVQPTHLVDLFIPTRLHFNSETIESFSDEIQLKFCLTGMLSFLGPPPFVIKMCPPLTTKNLLFYRPLLAVGCSNGTIDIVDLHRGVISRELSVHSAAVEGLDWCSLSTIVSFAVINVGASASLNVKNELMFVDLATGLSKPLLTNKVTSASPIMMVRVSPLKNYFIVAYKTKPFEIWDLNTNRMLREVKISSTAPITSLEWSPSARNKPRHKSTSSADSPVHPQSTSASTSTSTATTGPASSEVHNTRESFVFTNSAGLLCFFTVEHGRLQDASRYPPGGGMRGVTCLTWKGDVVAFGDTEGEVTLWDLKSKVTRGITVPRSGAVRKVKFAPGRGNNFLLIFLADGLDIWDAKDSQRISTYRNSKVHGGRKVLDADWAASSEPVLAFSDGTVRVCNLQLGGTSTIHFPPSLFCPSLLAPRQSFSLKLAMLFPKQLLQCDANSGFVEGLSCEQETDAAHELLASLPVDLVKAVNKGDTLSNCLLASRLFRDAWDILFWTTVSYFRSRPFSHSASKTGAQNSNVDDANDTTAIRESSEPTNSAPGSDEQISDNYLLVSNTATETNVDTEVLEGCPEVLLPNSQFRARRLEVAHQLASAATMSPGPRAAALRDSCASALIQLGDFEEASILLLATEPTVASFHANGLKTCLLTNVAANAEQHDENIPKLVATNLIASGFLLEGVEVLCMYGKYLEGCRYLQSYGKWNQAINLAKCSLDLDGFLDITKKWIEFLVAPQINMKNLAILVYISTGQFYKAVNLLINTQQTEKAYLFLKCIEDSGLKQEESELHAETTKTAREQLHGVLQGLGFGEKPLN